MKFSFIIPIYNTPIEKLEKCIDSIKKISKYKYEIILINDGSKNEDIVEFCKDKCLLDKNIMYVYQENMGSASARNKGLDCIDGDYIFFVDADDEFDASCVYSIDFKSDLYIFDYTVVCKESRCKNTLNLETDNITDKNMIYSSIMFNPFIHNGFLFGSIWGKCFRREVINKNNIRFDTKLRKAQDRRFMLDIIKCSSFIKYCPVNSYYYKVNNMSISHKYDLNTIKYYNILYNSMKKFCEDNMLDESVNKYLEFSIVNELLPLTVFHKLNKDSKSEKKKLFQEIKRIFNFDESLRKMTIGDFESITFKVKYLIYKLNSFYLIDKMISAIESRYE
ncbi:MAG: glycosyltransferase family 2 protein [Streptococcus lutetiensis]|nr:glycosyltransferase family 2 protein [Streptococcus lutetiensis]MDU2675875.1 glycosyltransferase family 2 protein [Streptococcus lutetiensis]